MSDDKPHNENSEFDKSEIGSEDEGNVKTAGLLQLQQFMYAWKDGANAKAYAPYKIQNFSYSKSIQGGGRGPKYKNLSVQTLWVAHLTFCF